MKILWLSHLVPYPPKAGVLLRSYNLLKEMTRYHDVDLLSFVQEDFFNQIYSNPEQGKQEAKSHLDTLCHRCHFVPIGSDTSSFGKYTLALKSLFTKAPYTINWLESDEYRRVLAQWLNETNYDAVHFDTISLDPYKALTGDVPAIMNHHNIESHLLIRRAEQEHNPIKRFYYHQEGVRLEQYEKAHCTHYQANITCSDMDGERLKEIDADLQPVAIPNGVDLEYFVPTEGNTTEKVITFIGTLNWEPNRKAVLFLAQKIWPLLKQKFPDVVCNIIGTHPPEELVRLGKQDPNFKVHGFVSDVRDYLTKGTIFVCPIKDGGGTKLKLLDAFAMKSAVVADPIACEGIDVTDGHNVLLATSAAEYVEKIGQLFSDDERRSTLGDHARELVENHYSYASIGRTLSHLYESISRSEQTS